MGNPFNPLLKFNPLNNISGLINQGQGKEKSPLFNQAQSPPRYLAAIQNQQSATNQQDVQPKAAAEQQNGKPMVDLRGGFPPKPKPEEPNQLRMAANQIKAPKTQKNLLSMLTDPKNLSLLANLGSVYALTQENPEAAQVLAGMGKNFGDFHTSRQARQSAMSVANQDQGNKDRTYKLDVAKFAETIRKNKAGAIKEGVQVYGYDGVKQLSKDYNVKLDSKIMRQVSKKQKDGFYHVNENDLKKITEERTKDMAIYDAQKERIRSLKDTVSFFFKDGDINKGMKEEYKKYFGPKIGAAGSFRAMGNVLPEFNDLKAVLEELTSSKTLGTMAELKAMSKNGSTGFGNTNTQEFNTIRTADINLDFNMSPEHFIKKLMSFNTKYIDKPEKRYGDSLRSIYGELPVDQAQEEQRFGREGEQDNVLYSDNDMIISF